MPFYGNDGEAPRGLEMRKAVDDAIDDLKDISNWDARIFENVGGAAIWKRFYKDFCVKN